MLSTKETKTSSTTEEIEENNEPKQQQQVEKEEEKAKTVENKKEEEEEFDDDEDDEDGTPEERWIPYHERDEWKDVTPVDKDAITEYPVLPVPLCSIPKNEYVAEVQRYLRAMLNADERSERALDLTRDAIKVNKSDFVAWYYRRNILFSLARVDLFQKELEFIEFVASRSSKNYQLYYHREAVVSFLQKHIDNEAFVKLIDKEFNWCTSVINEDSKNYHAWSYRQWIVTSFPEAANVQKEVRYIDFAIKLDPRNNSAWNYRFFIRFKIANSVVTQEEIMKDVEFAVDKIARSPNNPAPWNYINALLELEPAKGNKVILDFVKKFAEEACEKYPICAHCVILLADLLSGEECRDQRVALLEKLRDSVDTIRAKYWDSLINEEATKRT